ncbi:hypothetical protein KPL71_023375 [Citrus sinensis]|uniref:Uncharacterized protein n=1 Tax=Citrus sinensis TaxID=2711 RepID=A0ACB8IIP9_CITSI|nr:hypothetical protein KPL71_023375 [Citrus sinensis]
MRIYLQALDYEIWEVVSDGPFMPLTKNEFGEDIPKPSREWNELEKRKASLNSKAMNTLFCALDKKEFHRVSSCESDNEIWHKLEVVYEGTNQVKGSKISKYTRQYELFQIEQNESVYSMYTRFTDIVNTLGALGKTFSNSEKVKKIIRSLPKEWRPKRTAIEEAKNLNTLPLDDLIGSLISYEEDLAEEKGHEENKKSIALKASKYERDWESEPDDEELAILARRFRKFFKKTGERRKFRNFKNQREKKEVITCYECKKPGHIRSECPLINKLKKKAMVATWDDREEDSSDEKGSQEVSNLALMAIGEDDDLNEGLKKKKNKWYLDSGCSRHMTGNYAWFSSFTKIKNGGDISFGDNSKGKILGIGNVEKVVVDNDAYEDLQKKSSKDNQKDASHGNQDEQHEETNVEQNKDPSFSIFFTMAEYSRRIQRRKDTPQRNPIPPRRVSEFERIHFPIPSLAKHFEDRFNGRKVLDFYYVDIEDFRTLIVCGRSIRDMLQPWESAIDFDDRVYPNLVRVFYSNMKISATRLDWIVTQVGGVHIEINDEDLNGFLEDDRMLNDIYPPDQLLDFLLGAHPPPPRRRFVPQPLADFDSEEREMDADIPSTSMPPPAPAQPSAPEPSAVPERILERQQLIIDRLDTCSCDHQQLRSKFQTFQQQSIDQQLEFIVGQRTLLRYFVRDLTSVVVTDRDLTGVVVTDRDLMGVVVTDRDLGA